MGRKPLLQHFSGERHFQHQMPIDPSSMTRWRKRLGDAGAEQMLRATIEAGIKMKAIRPTQLQRINVDTTVQTKAVRYPTDARLYHRRREKLVKSARAVGLKIKQSYEHVGRRLLMQSSRYAHARQMKRAKACTCALRTQLGCVVREIERQMEQPTGELQKLLETAHSIHAQQRHDKKKIYSVHEPEVECIAKGKADKKYKFGNKVSVAVSSRGGWFIGTKSFTGNPYDGHTPAAQMKQVEKLLGKQIKEVHVDMGYRGHDYQGEAAIHVDKRCRGRTPPSLWRRMKHRAAVEPSIGHLKTEHRLERNRLKGVAGNAVNAVLAAAAMNFQKLLRAVPRYFAREIYAILTITVPLAIPRAAKGEGAEALVAGGQCAQPLQKATGFGVVLCEREVTFRLPEFLHEENSLEIGTPEQIGMHVAGETARDPMPGAVLIERMNESLRVNRMYLVDPKDNNHG